VARLEAAAQALRRRPRALIVATLWHLLGWLSQVAETWFVLWLVGARVSVLAALAIESLATTARGAAFFVPSGLGVQEGAVLALARALGVAPEPALALAVVKRLRELAVGAPGLIAWAVAEWRLPARLKAAAVLLPPTAPSTRKVTTDA
jgi:uncharacterized protein (TIRG00374 family)